MEKDCPWWWILSASERMISAARSKFAADSLLEGDGFELSVPRQRRDP
jgi:hypothetical protein